MASILLVFLAALSADPGFTPLFNGKTLDGWKLVRGRGPGYVVEDGKIVCPAEGGGNLFTEREFANFILRLEFKLSPGGNNGVGIRAPYEGDAAYQGMEIQVLDDAAPRYANLRPEQYSGSVYDLFGAKRGYLKPAGEWNAYEIEANGSRVKIKLNGTAITDADLSTVTDAQKLKKHPGIARKTGHIGFLGHGTRVEFRHIRIRELPD